MADKWPKIVVQLMHEAPRIRETLPDYRTLDAPATVFLNVGDIVTIEALEDLHLEQRFDSFARKG